MERIQNDDHAAPRRARPRRSGAVDLRLVLLLGVFVAVGIPFVAILWETLNELLAGHIEPRRLAVSLPLLVVFMAILSFAGRALSRHDRSS
jgi:uncharacterized membrane protein YfcA